MPTAVELRRMREWVEQHSQITPLEVWPPLTEVDGNWDVLEDAFETMEVTHLDGVPIAEADLSGKWFVLFCYGAWWAAPATNGLPDPGRLRRRGGTVNGTTGRKLEIEVLRERLRHE